MIPICLSPNPYTSLKQRLFANVLTFSLGCNPAWTGDLTSGVSYWEVCHTQWFCSLALSQTHTQCMHTNMPANAYKYLPRCEFLLREGLLCAAISISSQNTLIILPGSQDLSFSLLLFLFAIYLLHTHTHNGCTLFSQSTALFPNLTSTLHNSTTTFSSAFLILLVAVRKPPKYFDVFRGNAV